MNEVWQMVSIIRTATALLLLAAWAAPAAMAQQPLVLSLDEAIARGLADAPSLAEARAREAAAGSGVAAQAALRRPVVTTISGVLRTNHVDEFGVPQAGGGTRVIFPDIPTNVRARAEVTLPIYTSGRIAELVASAASTHDAARADSARTAADLRLSITTAYYTLLYARARTEVLVRALERADSSLETVRSRVDAGVLAPNDVLSAEAQRARQNVQLIQARHDAALAEVELARLIGADPGQPIALTTPVEQPIAGSAEAAATPADALVERARRDRPERQALVARERSRRSTAGALRAATRPHVNVLAAVEPARPNARFVPRVDEWNTGWDVAVNASWTVWDGGRSRAESAGAAAEADALGHRVTDFDRSVGVEVRQRLLDVEGARAALAAAGEAVRAAAEASRVLGERFLVGVATNTEVLDADLDWLEAELDQTRLGAALRLSEARLVRAVSGR
jgi:OMF family outer membrane factor